MEPTQPPPEPSITTDAQSWLKTTLATPQHVSEVISQWCGGVRVQQRNGLWGWEGGQDGRDGHFIQALIDASAALKASVTLGDDGFYWWRLGKEVH